MGKTVFPALRAALLAAAIASFASPGLAEPAAAGGEGYDVNVESRDGLLALEARDAPLGVVLGEVGARSGFTVRAPERLERRVTLSFSGLTRDQVLRRLLRDMNYVLLRARSRTRRGPSAGAELIVYAAPRPAEGAGGRRLPGPPPAALPTELRDIRALGHKGTPAAVRALSRVYETDANVQHRVAAVRGLGASGKAEAVAALEAALGDPSPWVRREAYRSLLRIGGDRARAVVEAAIKSESDDSVRAFAERMLKRAEGGARKAGG